jgi:hypothetical protein
METLGSFRNSMSFRKAIGATTAPLSGTHSYQDLAYGIFAGTNVVDKTAPSSSRPIPNSAAPAEMFGSTRRVRPAEGSLEK